MASLPAFISITSSHSKLPLSASSGLLCAVFVMVRELLLVRSLSWCVTNIKPLPECVSLFWKWKVIYAIPGSDLCIATGKQGHPCWDDQDSHLVTGVSFYQRTTSSWHMRGNPDLSLFIAQPKEQFYFCCIKHHSKYFSMILLLFNILKLN
jgi:hypothetical protein